ncbi:MAG TPA: hypothetical protein PLX22_08695, partial [Spirochaetota bacterium]|nr:hypothetical protein [Spirochaetota bacterium]
IYEKPFIITSSSTIKAIAYKTGYVDSDIAITEYTILPLGNIRITNNSGVSLNPVSSWNGNEYAIVWLDNSDNNNISEIFFTKVNNNGEKISNDIRITESNYQKLRPFIIWDNNNYAVVYEVNYSGFSQILFSKLELDGTKIISDNAISDGNSIAWYPHIIFNEDRYLITWYDSKNSNFEIYLKIIGINGNIIIDSTRLSNSTTASRRPVIAWNGNDLGIVWEENINPNSTLNYLSINRLGQIIYESTITSISGVSAFTSIAYDNYSYALVWSDMRNGNAEIYFTKINSQGLKILDDIRITVATGDSIFPSLVYNGQNFAISWQDNRSGNNEIYFALINSEGLKLTNDINISNTLGVSQNPYLLWNGYEYALAWDDIIDNNREIFFTKINPDGSKQ